MLCFNSSEAKAFIMNIFKSKTPSLDLQHLSCLSTDQHGILTTQAPILAYWWDVNQNFGDWIGPWLIARMTQSVVINTRAQQVPHSLFSVGSILGHITKDQGVVDVWGSGLIAPLEQKKILKRLKASATPRFHAVRGKLTQAEIESKMQWKVPNVFGDPALLISEFYTPPTKKLNIVVCPHHIHYAQVKEKLKNTNIHVIDVMQSPEKVIAEIANADYCLSSSLHGLIIAQAYQVPWTWLRFSHEPLVGDTFKFYDYFSIFTDGQQIKPVDLNFDNLNAELIQKISQTAALAKMNVSLSDLKDSFPL